MEKYFDEIDSDLHSMPDSKLPSLAAEMWAQRESTGGSSLVQQYIANLDADSFATREAARAKLISLGKPALTELETIHFLSSSEEQRLRIEDIYRQVVRLDSRTESWRGSVVDGLGRVVSIPNPELMSEILFTYSSQGLPRRDDRPERITAFNGGVVFEREPNGTYSAYHILQGEHGPIRNRFDMNLTLEINDMPSQTISLRRPANSEQRYILGGRNPEAVEFPAGRNPQDPAVAARQMSILYPKHSRR